MRELTEEDYIRYFDSQKEEGLSAAAELGQRIIDRAKWCKETERELPFLIADFKTLGLHVKLVYKGEVGDVMTFSLIDMHDPYSGVHGYLKTYLGDTGAFVMELIREMAWIYSLHYENGVVPKQYHNE